MPAPAGLPDDCGWEDGQLLVGQGINPVTAQFVHSVALRLLFTLAQRAWRALFRFALRPGRPDHARQYRVQVLSREWLA